MSAEHVEQFRDAMRESGMEPPEYIEPGKLHRFSPNGKRGDDAAWCKMFPDMAGGVFGDFRTGLKGTWQAERERSWSDAEREAFRQKCEAERREREAEEKRRRAEAREKAAAIWKESNPAPADHPYLARKRINPNGSRIHDGALVIPLRDATGELHSLQFISPDGNKKFLSGGRVSGCYFALGDRLDSNLCIAEGFATAASIHEATGYPVAVAFCCDNLKPVAKALRGKFPEAQLIICADNDAATDGNRGLSKATEAASAVGGQVAVPDFGEHRPEGATDFNDLMRLHGAEAVAQTIAAVNQNGANGHTSESVEWPDPKPIQAQLLPVPQFDPALLPDALRPWILDEADRMPCPPDFIAVAAIAAAGAVIGARCAIKPKAKDDWVIVPNLWGAIVALPSAKKSPAMGAAFKPIDRLIARAMEKHAAEAKNFEAQKVVHTAQKEAIESEIKSTAKSKASNGSNGSTLDGLARKLQTHQEQAPEEPILRRYKTNDTTVEKLGELLRDNPAGVMVLRDELVGLLATWEREGREGERALFLEAWNGNTSFDTDRIGRGSIFIPNLCVSVFGGIQPDKLTGYLEQAAHALSNDGMLQRFQLLVYPDVAPWRWRDQLPAKDARDHAFSVFDTLVDFDPEAWGAAPADNFTKFPHFRFGEAAQEIFIEWCAELHRERIPAEGNPLMEQHLAKFDKLFPAVALILHLIDCADTKRQGPVSEAAALRAGAWCEYLEQHARRCYGLLMDDGLRAAQALAEKVTKKKLKNGFTARDVRRNQWRYLTTDEAVQAALDWLQDESWLRAEDVGGTGPGAGRHTVRYFINPKIRGGKDGQLA